MATLSAVTMGVLSATPDSGSDLLAASSSSQSIANASALSRRGEATVSRSQIRTAAKAESAARNDLLVDKTARRLAKKVGDQLWTTADLNLWDGPSEKADKLGVIDAIKQVSVTGREQAGRTQVVIDGQSRWVTSAYLAEDKPEPGPSMGGACTNGTTASGGDANIQAVHEAVCANWPSISTYGTLRGGGGDHPLGKAVDIMVSGSVGWDVAEFVRANAAALGVTYVIYSQHIWSVERSGEGWRGMSDRGSTTANHYDHVHVSVY
ncbi:uncharacterized protein YraI [Nocardioides sp. BE266]|uniref:hypothetical protein n=1 Tax=Nocardioides sp. BE266 TaxID=2817725 RepID=UPI002855AD37|nr:hypothetical protein [Nocardioides sp. BE266]MDR7251043.1 uncharacterized protein YraI [Nocardioides sp. BE266]